MTLEFAPSSPDLTYDEAVMYCFLCTHDGHTDWRLPTIDEYMTYRSDQMPLGWYDGDSSDHFKRWPVTLVRGTHDT